MGDFGLLSVHVWPVYVGCSAGHPGDPNASPVAANEPFGDINYSRGQITWRQTDGGGPIGSASVFLPAGVYTHIVWFRGPHQEAFQDFTQMGQPLVFDRPGIFDIPHIGNEEQLPRPPAA
jgi:hypothetical protein